MCAPLHRHTHEHVPKNMENKEIIVEFDLIFFSTSESETSERKKRKLIGPNTEMPSEKNYTVYCDRTEFISLRR